MLGPEDRRLNRQRWPATFSSLAHRSFRLYFIGQATSILGSWIQQVALSWLVYRITGSTALLGLTAFASLAPQLFVGPLAGAWIDRHDKRRILITVELLLGLQAFALAALTWLDWVTPGLLIAMALMLGVLNSLDTPLRQSLLLVMVGRREDLPNAIALNAMVFNVGRFVGPPIAGFMVEGLGEGACFAANAVSFLVITAMVLAMNLPATPRASGSVARVFREGVAFARASYPVRNLLAILIGTNFTTAAFAVMLPVFAKDIFAGDARTLGVLWGAVGIGALTGTFFLTTRRTLPRIVQSIVMGTTLCTAGLLVFAITPTLAIGCAGLYALGLGLSVTNVGINTAMQSLAPDTLRGRIVSMFSSARFGFDAFGGLIAGALAAQIGARPTLIAAGLLLALVAVFALSRRRELRKKVVADGAPQ